MRPFVVGIGGGSGAGKSTLARRLAEETGETLVIELDWYYRDLSHLPPAERDRSNFDHPDAFEWTLLRTHLEALKRGAGVLRPCYDYATHSRRRDPVEIRAKAVTVVEGILALHDPVVCALMDLKVFVDAPSGLRLERRARRDVSERGRSTVSVARQFRESVAPMHRLFVEPTRRRADLLADGASPVERALAAIRARIQR